MIKNHVKRFGYLFVFTFLIISCAGTQLKQKQVADAYKGNPVSDILVIAITGNEHNRRSFEKKFVAHLKAFGVDAVASEEVLAMPADLKLKKETILDTVKQYENDAVIITQLVGKEDKESYTRGGSENRGFYGFYLSGVSYARDPGYSSTKTTVRLQTNLYDVKTEKLIWSGKTKTWARDSKDHVVNDLIKSLITSMHKNKLIAPK